MKHQMILKDGTAIDLAEAGITRHFVVLCESASAFAEIWMKMITEDNLSEVQITEDGTTVFNVTGMSLFGTQTAVNDDGTITGHFYCSGGTFQAAAASEAADETAETGTEATDTEYVS